MSDILHYYLDLQKEPNCDRFGFHNILNVMKKSRRGYVLNECFDGIDLHNEPLTGIHFSDDGGKNASSFRGCKVSRSCFLSGHSAPIESMEFIDDNTLVSRSENEVITWDIWSGMPIEIGKVMSDERTTVSLGKSEDSAFFKVDNISLLALFLLSDNLEKKLKKIVKKDYRIIGLSSDNRLVYLEKYYESFDNHYLVDTNTENLFCIQISPESVLKIDSCYIFFNEIKKEIYGYDTQAINPKPFSLNLSFKDKVSLKKIKHTNYVFAQFQYDNVLFKSQKDEYSSYIIDIEKRKIVLKFREKIDIPIFILEINCFLIKNNSNIIELYSKNNFKQIGKIEEKKSLLLSESSVKIHNNKDYIAISDHDFCINIYMISSGEKIKELGGYTSAINAIISHDRKKALLCTNHLSNNPSLIWDTKDNHILGRFNNINKYDNIYISFDSCTATIKSPINERICLIDLYTGVLKTSLEYDCFDTRTGNTICQDYNKIYEILDPFESSIKIYKINGEYEDSIDLPFYGYDLIISQNKEKMTYIGLEYIDWIETPYDDIPPHEEKRVVTVDLKSKQTEIKNHNCICLLSVSDDGRYVTVVSYVIFVKAIVGTQVLDMHEKKVCSEEIIENDYILLNYLKQYFPEQQDKYASDGWKITIPSSPDNSTFVTAYLVPKLYIKNCDFGGCIFEDETKEIIRQYLGLI